jgi:hypothetical protein
LLGPTEDLIKDKHLLIVPSGPLTGLPFNARHDALAGLHLGQPASADGRPGVRRTR